jgi:hypothetical protein
LLVSFSCLEPLKKINDRPGVTGTDMFSKMYSATAPLSSETGTQPPDVTSRSSLLFFLRVISCLY